MLYTDSGSPIPNDKPMEQFKASDGDWQSVKKLSEDFGDKICCTILELRDRVAELEKKARTAEKCNDAICRRLDEIRRKEPAATEESSPDRVLVRSQTGEYLRAGTPVYLAAPAALVPSDERLCEIWNDTQGGTVEHFRALFDHGYEQGLAAGRAEQQATTEPATKSEPEPGDFQTLHGIALDMVDSLGRSFHVLPEILDTLRRAIREPMAEQQAAAEATPEPEPEPVHSQYFSGHGLIAGEIDRALAEGGWTPTPEPTPEPEPSPSPAADAGLIGLVVRAVQAAQNEYWELSPEGKACEIIRAVARWLRSMGNFSAATNLEREANR